MAKLTSVENITISNDGVDDVVLLLSRQIVRTRTNAVTRLVENGLMNGDSVATIAQSIFEESAFSVSAAKRIAQTESTRSTNLGAHQAYLEASTLGVQVRRQWLSARDSSTRDTHAYLDGTVVGVNEEFVLPTGERGIAPASFDEPSENYNCRCTVIPIVD